MKISCSGRKIEHIHIRDIIEFELTHAKKHGNINASINDIDYVYGFVKSCFSPLYGGRVNRGPNLTKMDEYYLYDNNIGIKLPLSNRGFSEDLYENSKILLDHYHYNTNAIIVSNYDLADRIRNDYPKYKVELSAIADVLDIDSFKEAEDSNLFDTIVLPMAANDNLDLLNSIKNKDKVRLFLNIECSYTCPNKMCYPTISKTNDGTKEKMLCSFVDAKMPRTKYDDSVDWSTFYFDIELLQSLGYNLFKLVIPMEEQQRTALMYRDVLPKILY